MVRQEHGSVTLRLFRKLCQINRPPNQRTDMSGHGEAAFQISYSCKNETVALYKRIQNLLMENSIKCFSFSISDQKPRHCLGILSSGCVVRGAPGGNMTDGLRDIINWLFEVTTQSKCDQNTMVHFISFTSSVTISLPNYLICHTCRSFFLFNLYANLKFLFTLCIICVQAESILGACLVVLGKFSGCKINISKLVIIVLI